MSSPLEEEIIHAATPIPTPADAEERVVIGEQGLWLNQSEERAWRPIFNDLHIKDYPINNDPTPEHIVKTIHTPVRYIQSVWVKLLRPPSPPEHGSLIIKQESDVVRPPAPPIIIRQLGERPPTPETLVIREKPPKKPEVLPEETIIIAGKKMDPPARRVVIEKLPDLPAKPQEIIIEKWLPYEIPKRKVIYVPPKHVAEPREPVKNLLVEWRQPNLVVEKEVKCLGVEEACPDAYLARYGNTLRDPQDIEYDCGLDEHSSVRHLDGHYDLEGDLDALDLIDMQTRGRLGLLGQEIFTTEKKNTQTKKSHGIRNELQVIELTKDVRTGEYGILIKGGYDLNMSLYILKVVEGGSADRDGRLQTADEIIQINGMTTSNLKLQDIIDAFKLKNSVSLLIRRSGLPLPSSMIQCGQRI